MSRKKKSGPSRAERKIRKAYPEFEGRVQMTREGYAFIIIDGDEDDVFVKASKMKGALNGDTVKVVVTRPKGDRNRREGEVVEIVSRSVKPFVGVLHVVGNQAWVLMQSKNMPYDIVIPVDDSAPGHIKRVSAEEFAVHQLIDEEGNELIAKSGMKVAAKVDSWNRNDPAPTGHIVDVLGDPGANDTEMHAILAEFGLPYRFEPEVASAADSISEEITPKDIEGRRDFRDTLTFTIDPTDAKDFDDALSFKVLENGNYEVGVHIADVTYYVRPGDIVDEEAQKRGTSVYLVDRTVPMLPEKLSNKLCSLRPHEEKLTFSAVFEMTPLGRIADQWFGRTIIDSDYRFDYEGAQKVIEKGDVDPEYHTSMDPDVAVPVAVQEAVLSLHKLAQKLRKKRFASGAISFERPEMKVIVDEAGRPVDVCQKISKEANWLIEEFMLLANRSVSEFVAKQKKTFVYRIHDEPNMEKLESLRSFAHNFGYTLGPVNNGREISKALNTLFEESKDTPEFGAIELLSLRTMAKARYSTDNIGHYGLAFRYYTHFTSPIRRYPDMMVHRLLAQYLEEGQSANKDYFEGQCKHASEREVIAAEAERSSIKYKLVEFMQDKVGYEFEGHISGLTEWGMYVEIEPTKIEGMVPLRDIRSDFFEFDEENYRLVGRRTRVVYTLGNPVRIRVKRTNLEQKLLDYELVETGAEERLPREERRAEYERTRGRVRGADGYSDNIGSTRKLSGKAARKAAKEERLAEALVKPRRKSSEKVEKPLDKSERPMPKPERPVAEDKPAKAKRPAVAARKAASKAAKAEAKTAKPARASRTETKSAAKSGSSRGTRATKSAAPKTGTRRTSVKKIK